MTLTREQIEALQASGVLGCDDTGYAPELASIALDALAQLAAERQARLDAEAAVALVVERAAALRDAAKYFTEWDHCFPGNISLDLAHAHISNAVTAFDALASPSGVEELAKLRAREREAAMQALASMGQAQEAYEAQKAAEADRDRLAAQLVAMQAQTDQMTAAWGRDAVEVEELQARVKVLTMAIGMTAEQAHTTEIPEGYGPEDVDAWHQGFDAAIDHARRALAAVTPPAAQEGGE